MTTLKNTTLHKNEIQNIHKPIFRERHNEFQEQNIVETTLVEGKGKFTTVESDQKE